MASKPHANERRIPALAVSRGIGVGTVVFFRGKSRATDRVELDASEIEVQVQRFRSAVAEATEQLRSLAGSKSSDPEKPASHILGFQLLILESSPFVEDVISAIRAEKVNAGWAVRKVSDEHLAAQRAVGDNHLSEKRLDLEDLTERLLNALRGPANIERPGQYTGVVVVANELRPSILTELARARPNALITERGGWTSHASIIAREFKLPMVTGVRDLEQIFSDGDRVIVDGINGQLILEPDNDTMEKLPAITSATSNEPDPDNSVSWPVRTLDGISINIRANVDSLDAHLQASRLGIYGIGLYRSESLVKNGIIPSEAEQLAAYIQMADAAGSAGLKVRTFDLGRDDLNAGTHPLERNPSLGLRSLRLSLAEPTYFRTQVRAILRVAANREIDIVLPMVSGVADLLLAMEIIDEERIRLDKDGLATGDPCVGAMIEIPSAVLDIDSIVSRVDFLCLGTNDLVQYLLAADRDNDAVADWYQSLHPAVIRSISSVLTAGEQAAKAVQICGEIAGSAFYVPLLVGLGARELSMTVNSIETIRRLLSGIAVVECIELASKVRRCETADATHSLLQKYYRENWGHLFPPQLLSVKHR